MMDNQKIMEFYERGSNFYIFGAGKHAKIIFQFLQEKGIPVYGFVVSDKTENPEDSFDIPVMELKNFPKSQNNVILVSITKRSISYKPVFENLVKNQIHNLIFLTDDFITQIQLELLQMLFEKKLKLFFGEGPYYLAENIPVESYHRVFAMRGVDNREYHWRVGRTFTEKCTVDRITDLFLSKTALEECEEQYGTYHILHALERTASKRKTSCSVYMAYSHADKGAAQGNFSKWIVPIQVGVELTDSVNWRGMRDNLGDNISEKNGNYSECTALYWMWKHAPRTDYIGLCHYRRHFDLSENDFLKLEGNGIDIVVTAPTFAGEGIKPFFVSLTPYTDIEMLLKALGRIQPEYLSTAESFFKARFFPPCNLAIMKYDIFQEYAQFIFSVTFEVERLYDAMGIYRTDRYMGFLVECLLGIFLMHNKNRLKIAYTDMIFYS